MSAAELDAFLADHPRLRTVDAFLFDVSGRAIGKRLPLEDARKLWGPGMRLPASNLLYDPQGRSMRIGGWGVDDGDPDGICTAIAGTLAPMPWAGADTAQVMVSLNDGRFGGPVPWDTRAVLASLVARFAALGLTPVVACELEFYLVDRIEGPDIFAPARSARTRRAQEGECYRLDKLDDFAALVAAWTEAAHAQGLPAGAVSAEYGSSQFEINLAHQADAVRAADLALLQRRMVQAVARRHGHDATFMAKPFPDDAGSGLHVHVSLLDAHGNIFDERRPDGDARLAAAIGGLVQSMGDLALAFAPNPNAYRRFAPGMFAPLGATWAHDHRAAGIRVPAEGGPARRIEHRTAGADAHPHLVVAAILAGILDGLSRNADPGPPLQGDGGTAIAPELPDRLWKAATRWRSSALAAEAFGTFRDLYADWCMGAADAMHDTAIGLERHWLG